MKKLLTILFSLTLSATLYAEIHTGKCGENLTWSYDTTTKTLTISGQGRMYDFILSDDIVVKVGSEAVYKNYFDKDNYSVFKDDIAKVVINYGINHIGIRAFSEMRNLVSITIPNSVTSIGDHAFVRCSLTSISIPNSVTNIANYAFNDCKSLTSITIPNSVKSIGDHAFSWCSSLTSITIPNSVKSIGDYAFGYCWSLTSVTIPNSVTSIGNNAFYGCSSLTSITIPNSVTRVDYNAFKDILNIVYYGSADGSPWGAKGHNGYVEGNLVYRDNTKTELLGCLQRAKGHITIPNSVTSIGDNAFYGCSSLTSITIPNSVTGIGDNAFYGCSSLTSISIPNSVIVISEGAFQNCYELKSITIPNSVTVISEGAFQSCYKLKNITIPNSVTSIGNNAFYGCSSLTSITIPNSVTSIGKQAFEYCSSLMGITVPNSVTSIGDRAFLGIPNIVYYGSAHGSSWGAKCRNGYVEGNLVYKDNKKTELRGCYGQARGHVTIPNSVTNIGSNAFGGCDSLTSISIPNSVTSIGDDAFRGCRSLTSITIPNSVTNIANGTFSGCSSLTSISIPNSVTSIGDYAFSLCSSLTSITIPNSVTSIGNYAFYWCSSLTSITIPNSVTSIGNSVFYWCSSLTSITIPNSVTSIGDNAFNSCYYLTSITIPNSVTSIGKDAFRGIPNIKYFGSAHGSPWGAKCRNGYVEGNLIYKDNTKTELIGCSSQAKGTITIPNTVKTIGESTFAYCRSLVSITIPSSVTSIGKDAFRGIPNIKYFGSAHGSLWGARYRNGYVEGILVYRDNTKTELIGSPEKVEGHITIPNSVTSIGNNAFDYCSLTSVTIPNSVTNIANKAFRGCSSLTSITIPNSVTSIGDDAFYGCSSLTSIMIPNSVTSIGDNAFNDCSSLTSITIPNSVTSIGKSAFWGSSLTSITIPNSVTSIGDYAFYGCEKMQTLYYHQGFDVNLLADAGLDELTKILPIDPPFLTLINGSAEFMDMSNNNCIDANEYNHISFKISNKGKGQAQGCKVKTILKGTTSGISVDELSLPSIAAGNTYEVSLPIRSNINTQNGKVTFSIEVYEPGGWGIAPFEITIATRAYDPPFVQVVDYAVSSSSGKIQKMEPFTLTFNLQNTQYGDADDVHVNIELPKDVFLMDGKTYFSFEQLKSGEVKTIQLVLAANNNYSLSEIPIDIDVKEKYGKYAENKQIPLVLNQGATNRVTITAKDDPQRKRGEIPPATIGSDVDKNIPVTTVVNEKTFAVIIANENYQQVANVPYALNDGNIFRQYCEKTLGIPESNIRYVPDATLGNIRQQVNWLRKVIGAFNGDVKVIFYYAGHGVPDENSKTAFLLPVDGSGSDISMGYKLDDLYLTLGELPSKSVTIFLDACFSGSKRENGMLDPARRVVIEVKGGQPVGNMVVFSAAQGDQTAYPINKEGHGMFTYYLLKKLQETAGEVSYQELSEYIRQNVSQQSIVLNNKSQTPTTTPSATVGTQWQSWKMK